MKVIAITGYARVGKDKVSKIIKRELENKTINSNIFKISAPLYDILYENNLLKEKDINFLKKVSLKSNFGIDFTYRELMVAIATYLRNRDGEDIFLNKLIDKIKNSDVKVAIINDMRFLYEAKRLKKEFKDNLFIVKIKRDKVKPSIKEKDIDKIEEDFLIENNVTDIEDLTPLIKQMIEKLNLFY